MNLLENLVANGVTFNVANVKKGNIADKAITLSMSANKVEVNADYHLKFTRKNGKELVTVSPTLIEMLPTLADKGVGFRPFVTDKLYLLHCDETMELTPIMYHVKKGETKSSTFKADAMTYSLELAKLITKEEGEWKFNLVSVDNNPGLYSVIDATVEITVNDTINTDDTIVGQVEIETTSENVENTEEEIGLVQELLNEDVQPVATAIAPNFVYEAPEVAIEDEF
jgi:hypothetical protein